MITINIDPIIFSIGPLSVRWYGLMYVVAITVGLLIVWRYAKWKGFTDELLEKIVVYSVLAGFIGARLYFVLQQPLEPYLKDPFRIFAVWEGGMAFYGAIFGVVLTLIVLSKYLKFSLLSILDVAGLFAACGQFFGRIGNIINGDVLGYQTTLPWGFKYTNPGSFAPSHDIAYQPAAVYEAIINVIIFSVLWSLRKKYKPGVLFFIYIISYSVSQILVFFVRDNEVIFLGLKQAQLTAIVTIIVAVAAFFVIRKRQQVQAVTSVATEIPPEKKEDGIDKQA
jgi:phosphatidylglycerol:prolipoprotein diacylglycerol transferase